MSDEPIVRMTRPGDLNDIQNLDVKCYHYPLLMDDWKVLINGKDEDDDGPKSEKAKVEVVEVHRKKVGYSVLRRFDDTVMMIERLGVRETFRRHGLGRMLVDEANLAARHMKVDVMRIVIPEIQCKPGDPDDVSAFLNATSFHPTGKIVPAFAFMYGDDVDGYVWERKVL
jgi:predicted GNAT family acetyltransferase